MPKTVLAGNYGDSATKFSTQNKTIKIIELYGLFRISMRLFYDDGSFESFGDLIRFRGSMDLSQDKISKIDYCSNKYLEYICIRTLKGKIIKAGEPDIDIKCFNISNEGDDDFIGFYGSFGKFIYCLGLILKYENDSKKDNVEKSVMNVREMKKNEENQNQKNEKKKNQNKNQEEGNGRKHKKEKKIQNKEKIKKNQKTSKVIGKQENSINSNKIEEETLNENENNEKQKIPTENEVEIAFLEKNEEIMISDIKPELKMIIEDISQTIILENPEINPAAFQKNQENLSSNILNQEEMLIINNNPPIEDQSIINEEEKKNNINKENDDDFDGTKKISSFLQKLSNLPENIKIIIVLSNEFCEIASKFLNFLRDISENRFIMIPNEKYHPNALTDGLEKYINEFQMSSDVLNKEEVSIIVIDIPQEWFNIDVLKACNLIIYFSVNAECCLRNYIKARMKSSFKIGWKSFLSKSSQILTRLKNSLEEDISDSEEIINKLFQINTQDITNVNVNEQDLWNMFEDLLKNKVSNNKFLQKIDFSIELEKIKNWKSNKEKVQYDDRQITEDTSYYVWANKFCGEMITELENSKTLSFQQKHKIRTFYINRLFSEFNLLKEQKFSLSSVILRKKMKNNKNFGVNLCVFLKSYISEFLREKLIEKDENEVLVQKIIDQSSYLIEEIFQASDYLNCYRLIEILSEVTTNENLQGELTESPEFIELCYDLLKHNHVFFNIQGQKLLFKALGHQPQLYCLRIWQEEQKNPHRQQMALLILDNVLNLSIPLEHLSKIENLIHKYMIMLENYKIFQIRHLYEHSFYNCAVVTKKTIDKLFILIEVLFVKMQEYENTTYLLGLLTSFLKFCGKEIISQLLEYYRELAKIANQCLNYYLEIEHYEEKFKICVEFLNTLWMALSKYEFFIKKSKLKFNQSEQTLALEYDNIDWNSAPVEEKEEEDEKVKNKKNKKKNKKEDKINEKNEKKNKRFLIDMKGNVQNLLENSINLKNPSSKENYKLYNMLDKEKLKLMLNEMKNENYKLLNENLLLKGDFDKQEVKCKDLFQANQQLEQEKFNLKSIISKAMETEEKLKTEMILFKDSTEHSLGNKPNLNIFDEDHNDLLNLTSPSEISELQAQKFIENLQITRKNMRELRSSICGALKFLGNDLYSSSTHFFYEIIQNAEDNQYNPLGSPNLIFFLTESFILICNNEKGFLPKNVAAICQIGQSSKMGGYSIGQKGLGFKSVFSCSDNPHIISYPWRFHFRINENNDELQYITPYWAENIPEEIRSYVEKNSCQTNIFLPFKSGFSKERKENMIKQISEAVDENILLNLSNLNEISVCDEVTQLRTLIMKTVTSQSPLGERTFNKKIFLNIIKREISIAKTINDNNSKELEKTNEKFLTYTCEIEIPDLILQEEKTFKSNSKTRMLLAFPLINKKKSEDMKGFYIYAFLPVLKENYGFKFLVNCDWVLTTNRESIRQNDWNVYIRNSLAQFFLWIIFEDVYIRNNFYEFLPKNDSIKNIWWERFTYDILEEIRRKDNIIKLFNFDGKKDLIISNEKIRTLISFKKIQEILPNIFIIDLNEHNMNAEVFNKSLKTLSMEHVLDCLEDSNFLEEKLGNSIENKKWWKDFYSILLEELNIKSNDTLFLNKVRNSSIYMTEKTRFRLPNMNKKNCNIFLNNKNTKIKTIDWREEFIFLEWDSENEYKVLVKVLQISEMKIEKILETLYNIHLNFNFEDSDAYTCEILWKDLDYIKKHYTEFEKIFPNQNLGLIASIKTAKNSEKSLDIKENPSKKANYIPESVFPYILGVFIESKHFKENQPIIEIEKTFNSLEEILIWEEFFIKIGCKLPNFNNDLCLSQCAFHEFESLSDASLEIISKILEVRPSLSLIAGKMKANNIKKLVKVQSNQVDDINLNFENEELVKPKEYLLNQVFDINLVNNEEFPCIEIPHKCRKLAEKLGVTIKSNFRLSLKILETMVRNRETSLEKFQKWLIDLNSSLNEKNIEEFLIHEGVNNEILYFPMEGTQIYYSIKDLFIYEEKDEEFLEFLDFICKKNNKILISIKNNIEYLPFQYLFKKLGCQSQISFEFLDNFVQKLIEDEEMYYEKGNRMSLLSEKGLKIYEKTFNLYENLLEKKCNLNKMNENSLKSWDFRKEMNNVIRKFKVSNAHIEISLPFITYGKVLLPTIVLSSKLKFACLNIEIINEITNSPGSEDYIFFEPNFALKYPKIIAFLEIEYLELNSQVIFANVLKNRMRILVNLSKKFNEFFQLEPNVEIVKGIFAPISLQIINGSENYDNKNITKFKLVMRNPFVYAKDLIYLCDPDQRLLNKGLVFKAMTEFLKEFNKKTYEENDLFKIIEQAKEDSEVLWTDNNDNKNVVAFYNTEAVRFPSKNTEILEDLTEMYMEQRDTQGLVNYDKKPLHSFYMQKIKDRLDNKNYILNPYFPSEKSNEEKISNIKAVEPSIFPPQSIKTDPFFIKDLNSNKIMNENKTGPFIVNNIEIQQIGLNAEHFFFAYLSSIAPQSCQPQNWISSNRLCVFPYLSQNVNDSAGYDFELVDTLQIFKKFNNNTPLRLFFEVKGSKHAWNRSFVMSSNEIKKADECFLNPYMSYYIVVVENVAGGDIGIAAWFDWKETKQFLKFESESSKIEWDNKKYNGFLNNQNQNYNQYQPRDAFGNNFNNIHNTNETNRNYVQQNQISNRYPQENKQQNKTCFNKFFCKDGKRCRFNHTEAEKTFFKHNGVDGHKRIDNSRWKVEKCKQKHKTKEDQDMCIFSHDESDSYCLNCDKFGHLEMNCTYHHSNPNNRKVYKK